MALYDHLQDLKWVWVQSKGKLAPKAIFEILATGMNLAEQAIEFVRSKLNVVDATGVYLDRLGAKYGVARMGLSDDEYRKVIIVEATSLFGSGDAPLIYRLIRSLIGPEPTMKVWEFPFHTFVAYIGMNVDIPEVTQKILGQTLDDVPALTINGTIVAVDEVCFTYASTDGDVEVVAGFSSTDNDVPGSAGFASAIPL